MADREFERLRHAWEQLGASDPMWAVLTDPQKRGNRWDPAPFFESGRDEVEQVMRAVAARCPDLPRGIALDFGCGIGRVTRPLAAHFRQAVGVDIAESMVRRARELNADAPNCEFAVNPGADLAAFATGSMDFVYSRIVLQHIAPRFAEGYIREFLRLLSPRGLALFQVPSHRDGSPLSLLYRLTPDFLLRRYRHLRYGPHHVETHAVHETRVAALASAAGARIEHQSREAHYGWIDKWYWIRRA